MNGFARDQLVFTPDMVDLGQPPLAAQFDAEKFVPGAFNPALTILLNGNLLMMVRITEALRQPIRSICPSHYVPQCPFAASRQDRI